MPVMKVTEMTGRNAKLDRERIDESIHLAKLGKTTLDSS